MTTPTRQLRLEWTASAFGRRLLTVTGLALTLAFALGRPQLVVLAAAACGWLAVPPRRGRAGSVSLCWTVPDRCFEGEPVPVSVEVRTDQPVDLFRVVFVPGAGLAAANGTGLEVCVGDSSSARLDASVVSARWGRRPLGRVIVECWAQGRLRHASVVAGAGRDLAVYPRPEPVRRLPAVASRYDRAGDHSAAVAGPGVEFGSVRPFTAGDSPRRVNWPVSTRRGRLYITARQAELAVDVVIAVDVLTDAGPAGHTSRDLALRGATGLAQAALRSHDRVGLIAVGGRLQWLRPDLTERQFYRIAEAMLDVVEWESAIDPDVDTIPYAALPAGAHVLYFSPLLDERGVVAAARLRARGHPLTIIDLGADRPAARGPLEQLGVQLWQLDRVAARRRLVALGITVVDWHPTPGRPDGAEALDGVLSALPRTMASAR